MKAVRIHEYGGPERLVFEDVDRPSPSAGQVLVRVRAASVNPVDIAVREGRFPTPKEPPKIIGSDGSGVVEELGDGVETASVGDEVVFSGLGIGSDGSYAEFALVAAVQAVPKPASLTFEQAAAMGLVFPTAYYALARRATLREGETVLVQGGAGGIGTAAVQLARAFGASKVFASVSRAEDVEAVKGLGADEVFLRSGDVAAAVRQSVGSGVDVIVDVALSENLEADLGALAKGGRIVAVGTRRPEVTVPVGRMGSLDAGLFFMSSANAGRAGVAQIMRSVSELVEAGKVRPVVGDVLPLAEARRAHELLAAHHFGKVVLQP